MKSKISPFIKEFILDAHLNDASQLTYEKAADVLAENMAIAFYEWAKKNKRNHRGKTTKDLYHIFINEIKIS